MLPEEDRSNFPDFWILDWILDIMSAVVEILDYVMFLQRLLIFYSQWVIWLVSNWKLSFGQQLSYLLVARLLAVCPMFVWCRGQLGIYTDCIYRTCCLPSLALLLGFPPTLSSGCHWFFMPERLQFFTGVLAAPCMLTAFWPWAKISKKINK